MGLWRLREFVQAHQAERKAKGLVSPSAEILYVSRYDCPKAVSLLKIN